MRIYNVKSSYELVRLKYLFVYASVASFPHNFIKKSIFYYLKSYHLSKVNNENTRRMCERCPISPTKAPAWHKQRRSSVFIAISELISHLVPVPPLLTLNEWKPASRKHPLSLPCYKDVLSQWIASDIPQRKFIF